MFTDKHHRSFFWAMVPKIVGKNLVILYGIKSKKNKVLGLPKFRCSSLGTCAIAPVATSKPMPKYRPNCAQHANPTPH